MSVLGLTAVTRLFAQIPRTSMRYTASGGDLVSGLECSTVPIRSARRLISICLRYTLLADPMYNTG